MEAANWGCCEEMHSLDCSQGEQRLDYFTAYLWPPPTCLRQVRNISHLAVSGAVERFERMKMSVCSALFHSREASITKSASIH